MLPDPRFQRPVGEGFASVLIVDGGTGEEVGGDGVEACPKSRAVPRGRRWRFSDCVQTSSARVRCVFTGSPETCARTITQNRGVQRDDLARPVHQDAPLRLR
ncbi:hypothetical protein GCM10020227_22350 [Streptomyces flavovirens]